MLELLQYAETLSVHPYLGTPSKLSNFLHIQELHPYLGTPSILRNSLHIKELPPYLGSRRTYLGTPFIPIQEPSVPIQELPSYPFRNPPYLFRNILHTHLGTLRTDLGTSFISRNFLRIQELSFLGSVSIKNSLHINEPPPMPPCSETHQWATSWPRVRVRRVSAARSGPVRTFPGRLAALCRTSSSTRMASPPA